MPVESARRKADRGFYVDLHESPDGYLHVLLNCRGREEFGTITAIHDQYGIRAALIALIDDHLQGAWELVHGRDLGALTSGPILSRDIERDLDGTIVTAGRVYWYPDFAVLDEIEELYRHGFLEFRSAV
jgi:hypothetical protein